MRRAFGVGLIFSLFSCSSPPSIDGFNANEWNLAIQNCTTYRMETVQLVVEAKNELVGLSQQDVQGLLGKPEEQKLFDRHQKFLLYPLSCQNKQSLSIRLDALGRVREIQVIQNQ